MVGAWGLLWERTKAAVSVLMKLGLDMEVRRLLSPRKGPQPCQSIFCRCSNPLGTVATTQSCLLPLPGSGRSYRLKPAGDTLLFTLPGLQLWVFLACC